MAMTEGILLFLAGMALLATIGMFQEYGDRWTVVLVAVTASILWGIVGLESFDVVKTTSGVTTHYEILSMVYVGIGFSMITGFFALYHFLKGVSSETGMTETDGLAR